jgi:IMP dehydrogenase
MTDYKFQQALTYDDIALVPQYSEVVSRSNVNLTTLITRRYGILSPVIAAPMDTVCEYDMYVSLLKLGAVGCVHRFMSIDAQVDIVRNIRNFLAEQDMYLNWGVPYDNWHAEMRDIPVIAAVGAVGDYYERAQSLVAAGANVLLIDVAHGHHINVKNAISKLKGIAPHIDVIAGNIATKDAALDLVEWGADALRVGVGGGSACTTRIKTGFGVPNVTALIDVITYAKVPVIADGGIRDSGDIAKALALGSSSVMLGSLLAGTEESPGAIVEKKNGLFKLYRGAASYDIKAATGQPTRNIEGESTLVPYKGGVKYVVSRLLDGVRSALSYAGSTSISEFYPDIVTVTASGVTEAKPHILL